MNFGMWTSGSSPTETRGWHPRMPLSPFPLELAVFWHLDEGPGVRSLASEQRPREELRHGAGEALGHVGLASWACSILCPFLGQQEMSRGSFQTLCQMDLPLCGNLPLSQGSCLPLRRSFMPAKARGASGYLRGLRPLGQ